jgi:hypothetical protein
MPGFSRTTQQFAVVAFLLVSTLAKPAGAQLGVTGHAVPSWTREALACAAEVKRQDPTYEYFVRVDGYLQTFSTDHADFLFARCMNARGHSSETILSTGTSPVVR